MLEFRLSAPDASAVVGSVGPPPIRTGLVLTSPTIPEVSKCTGGGEWGGSRRSAESFSKDFDNDRSEGGDSTTFGQWEVTRQSEWVEARPFVYLSLVSCASPDPGSSGFWFWCVASRQATPLSDCRACMSRAVGHRCHLGQMAVDLRPVAIVWNCCSQPMRVVLNGRGGGGDGWSEHAKPTKSKKTDHEQRVGGAIMQLVDTDKCECDSSYRLVGSMHAVQPGGHAAVCQQPFVDSDLALTPAPVKQQTQNVPLTALAQGPDNPARPFLVSVPSELLSRKCKPTWLPLHSRALTDNVLCPLVVVASRLWDAHWPSLSLRIHPGLSVRNHLTVPLSLRTTFSRPSLEIKRVSVQQGESKRHTGMGRRKYQPSEEEDHTTAPLLGGAGFVGSEPCLANSERDGDDWNSVGGDNSSVARLARVFRAPARSLHSVLDIFNSEGCPIPFILPALSVEVGLGLEEAAVFSVSDPFGPAIVDPRRAAGNGDAKTCSTDCSSNDSVSARCRKLHFSLDGDLNELVLIPWGGDSGVVFPVFVTLERQAILGGIELIRLEVHPRVMVHNATGLPISLSLKGGKETPDKNDGCADGGQTYDGAVPVPMCRVDLTSAGSKSSMSLLALPWKRPPLGSKYINHGTLRAGRGHMGADGGGDPTDTPSRAGLRGTLSWLVKSSSYKAAPLRPAGFYANVEVAFSKDLTEQDLHGNIPTAGGKDTFIGVSDSNAPETAESIGRTHPGVAESATICLSESSGGDPLCFEPSSLTVVTEGGRCAVRVCVAAESSGAEPSPPTRHILLYRDPQPDLTVCNRSTGSVTILFDCGSLVEVGPGGTADHSWQEAGIDRKSSASFSIARPNIPPDRRGQRGWADPCSRGASEVSHPSSPISSASRSPATAKLAGVGTQGRRQRHGSGSLGSSPAAKSKVRPTGKLGSDATLQHWFQFKGGGKEEPLLPWSDPIWVAQGVQVVRFDKQTSKEGTASNEEDWDFSQKAQGDRSYDEHAGFGAGLVREVQVHVTERAGGFVMSFAEGGFEGAAVDSNGKGRGSDGTTEESK